MAMGTVDLETWFIEQQIRIRQRLDRAVGRVMKDRKARQEESLQGMTCDVRGTRVLGESHHGPRPLPTRFDDEIANLR